MKKVFFFLVPLLLTACSEQKFNCDGMGLVLKKDSAIYGPIDMKYCKQSGVKKYFAQNCDSESGFKMVFDDVTNTIGTHDKAYVEGDKLNLVCKKL